MRTLKNPLLVGISALVLGVGYYATHSANQVDFTADVKPILNKKCMACHGGVKKAGGFSLLFREEALGKTKSGKPAILPGDAEHSEIIRRITHKDPDQRMPKKGDPLTDEEIRILTDWVEQGAEWGTHWAYKPVEKPEVPMGSWWARLKTTLAGGSTTNWAVNDIDYFVLDKQREAGLSPSKQADKAKLLRRVSLDLTGLPPTEEQYQRFLNDKRANAYELAVDSLLASPAYGERWATMWLDLARYADSKGYEKDDGRNIWRYRDWVIKAFNQNMPYRQFITEQLAGDLLPQPTEDQLIATAFHRNTANNDEGGTDDEEFRVSAVLDRVSTNWVAFNSTTFACAQCHSHPYDPFRHEDFYKYMAFFNNTRDEDVMDESAHLRFFNEKDQPKLDSLTNWLKTNVSEAIARQYTHFVRTVEPRIYAHHFDSFQKGTAEPSSYLAMQNGGTCRLPNAPTAGKNKLLLSYATKNAGGSIEIRTDSLNGPTLATVKLDTSGSRNFWNGLTLLKWVDLPRFSSRKNLHFIFRNPRLTDEKQDVCLVNWVMFLDEDLPGKDKPGYAGQLQNLNDLLLTRTDNVPILQENPAELARTTRIFERGSFLTPTKAVQPDVPQTLLPFPTGAPRNRLGLAMWLTANEHPLTARTMVNRLWEQLFGTGLVETLEDMGSQGFTPTHPELLDYLSYRFMHDWNWQLKPLLKELVLSATYRQDAHATDDQLTKDPANQYLARGPRVRLSGEQIRDQALLVSGLLSPKMYGKPVMPYQPQGVWQVVYSGSQWKQSEGEDAYRRAIYTYVRRSSPYPSLSSFDGLIRDVCLARRIRTNTPLQALVTLNDSAFVEMAQNFALRLEKEGGSTIDSRLQKGYYLMTGQVLPPKKQRVLKGLYTEALTRFRQEPQKAEQWFCGAAPGTAALALVANTMFNMDEFVTKE
ncbi:hypothetical protein GCM10023189_56910 [Nibrella saemangeumensis]|uniref:Cytochrome c domain-containing protein n=1 Tax=Nibrella saemangeumensis TaxID=1084526 RepID=A0ABP8NQE2_9BACT